MRTAKNTVLIGTNGTGKTTLIDSIINELGRRCLVVVNNDEVETWHKYGFLDIANENECKTFTGIRRIVVSGGYEDKTFHLIEKNITDGIVVFDDCRKYIKSNMDSQPDLKNLLVSFRHKGLDMFFVVHSVDDLPPNAWGNMTDALIGHSQRLMSGSRLKQLNSADDFLRIQKAVSDEFNKKYKSGGKAHYGIFKHLKL